MKFTISLILLALVPVLATAESNPNSTFKRSALSETETLSPAVKKSMQAEAARARSKTAAQSKPNAENSETTADDQSKINGESTLRFSDTYRSPTLRDFNWVASFEFSHFQTSGEKALINGQVQTIDDRNNIIPRVSFGSRYNLIKAGPKLSAWFLGVEAGAAFSTDAQKVQLSSRAVDAQLNHTLIDVGLKTSMAFSRFPRLNWGVAQTLGQVTSNQSSSDGFADWTESTGYRQTSFSADYDLSRGWFGTLAFAKRENLQEGSVLNMSQSQWRAGLGVVW
jgi:hypothetical protein